jgi:putative transposase
MKEAYAVRRSVPPSSEIQASIDKLLSKGMVDDPQKMLSELARLGARLIIQRAVEDEFDQWLGRARYERRPERLRGLRNGFPPRHLQTPEGELRIEIPQAREAAMPFVSKLFAKWHCERLLGTDPLKALIIGGFVRGLSMREVESLCEEAGLARTSKSTVSRVCAELHERFEAFCRRSLYDINLVVLFLDAIYLPVRRSGPKEGVICAWGITETGARALVSVRLGRREAKEDWLELGRDLTARGLPAPRLVVADGAAGLPSAAERDLAAGGPAVLRCSPPAQSPGEAPEVRAGPDPFQLLVSAHRRDLGQGRQAPPQGPDLRTRACRLPAGRALSRR